MTNSQATETGTLYIVATPIGNRDDITLRALTILKSVDLILAEDTRHSKPLLTSLGINTKLNSLHAHNEHQLSEQIIKQLRTGLSIALISDAGTPLISDPGYPLVKLARQSQIPVVPIPGASALITALSAAGIPCDSFLFVGFLPAKQQARKNKLALLKNNENTIVFYESTHRILECLEDFIDVFGPEQILVLAKELTKSHERIIEGTAFEIKEWLLEDPGHIKGEFVLLVPPSTNKINTQSIEELLSILLKELPLKQAVSIASQISKVNKNEVYDLALSLKKSN